MRPIKDFYNFKIETINDPSRARANWTKAKNKSNRTIADILNGVKEGTEKVIVGEKEINVTLEDSNTWLVIGVIGVLSLGVLNIIFGR